MRRNGPFVEPLIRSQNEQPSFLRDLFCKFEKLFCAQLEYLACMMSPSTIFNPFEIIYSHTSTQKVNAAASTDLSANFSSTDSSEEHNSLLSPAGKETGEFEVQLCRNVNIWTFLSALFFCVIIFACCPLNNCSSYLNWFYVHGCKPKAPRKETEKTEM